MSEKLGEALLDLDTRDRGFRRGIAQAKTGAERLGRTFDATAKKAIALGKGLAIGAAAGAAALSVLVKREIDRADAMSKAAQRAGVTTEALSRLAWAGELSDVSLADLSRGMQLLSQRMLNVTRGADAASEAIFDALGIELIDAEGKLRNADQVLLEVADRFAQMEDGALKTAASMQLFGRSGSQMITLLNLGRKGLQEYADESDRLNQTISTGTGRAAEQFNDTMTRIGAGMNGIIRKVAEGVLPNLQTLADKLVDPKFAQNSATMANWMIGGLNAVIDAVNLTVDAIEGLADLWGRFAGDTPAATELRGGSLRSAYPTAYANALQQIADELDPAMGTNLGPGVRTMLDDLPTLAERVEKRLEGFGNNIFAPYRKSAEEAANASNAAEVSIEDLIAALASGDGAAGSMGDGLDDLADDAETAADAMAQLGEDIAMTLGQTLIDVVTGAEDAGAALERLGQQILSMVLNSAVRSVINTAFGGADAGGMFSGFFAKGGLIPAGSFGIVGEKGPEPVIGTGRGAMVLPNSAMSAVAGGGRAEVNVQVINNAADETDTRVEQDGDGNVLVMIDRAMANAVTNPGSRTSKALRNGWGMTPATRSR